jgi:hypothetical protein
MKVDKGGGDLGKTVTLRTNEYTSVQVGMDFVNRPGQKLDLTEHFKPGDYCALVTGALPGRVEGGRSLEPSRAGRLTRPSG